MATLTMEERLTAVEAELAQLKQQLPACTTADQQRPWWDQIFGAFADSPEYELADRLGREYRESLRPKDGEDEGA